MHPVTTAQNVVRLPHLRDRPTTMELDGFPRNSIPVNMGSMGCRSPSDYFGINPALTPPASVTTDDAKSETRENDADADVRTQISQAIVVRATCIINAEAYTSTTVPAPLVLERSIK